MTNDIGDVNATSPGSGARNNKGKTQLQLIPLWIVANVGPLKGEESRPLLSMLRLSEFQMREPSPPTYQLEEAIAHCGGTWKDCADVFDYGRKKYAEWNWLKGMPWSVVIGCAARHLMKIAEGELIDDESGLPHAGHVMCNIVMLMQYTKTWTAGDDRPKTIPADVWVASPGMTQVPICAGAGGGGSATSYAVGQGKAGGMQSTDLASPDTNGLTSYLKR